MGCAASRKLYDETRIDVAKPEAFPVAPVSQRLKQANKYALPQSLNQMAGYGRFVPWHKALKLKLFQAELK